MPAVIRTTTSHGSRLRGVAPSRPPRRLSSVNAPSLRLRRTLHCASAAHLPAIWNDLLRVAAASVRPQSQSVGSPPHHFRSLASLFKRAFKSTPCPRHSALLFEIALSCFLFSLRQQPSTHPLPRSFPSRYNPTSALHHGDDGAARLNPPRNTGAIGYPKRRALASDVRLGGSLGNSGYSLNRSAAALLRTAVYPSPGRDSNSFGPKTLPGTIGIPRGPARTGAVPGQIRRPRSTRLPWMEWGVLFRLRMVMSMSRAFVVCKHVGELNIIYIWSLPHAKSSVLSIHGN
ncbi:hypothetical protein DFH07DRAFT_357678 [Mycena maculata]|uniref:Uncharacterized protein n=1 Tax=Mycena maculata TaxID=230809 RepID=A0AAD7JJ04_9AGAR|nr:hypothetical protein DFH07DRAFT_357678 [Mycena maculata]